MSSIYDAFRKQLGYMLSLPERSIRSLAALAGGSASLLTETLVPETLKGSTCYRTFIGDTQQFIVQRIAQVRPPAVEAADAADGTRFVQRKMVGSALETAGLLAMHMSPLWVLALASDAAAGGGLFFNRLVDRLKVNGVLPKHTEVKGMTDLLAAIQEAARKTASAVDTPPLGRHELASLADDMLSGYRSMFAKGIDLLPRLETIWSRMEEVARREKISFERLSGILSVDLAGWARRGVGTISAVGQTGSELLGENILDSYSRTLDGLNQQGVRAYVQERMQPFLRAAVSHFDPQRTTVTEAFLASLGELKGEDVVSPTEESAAGAYGAAATETSPPPPPTGA